MAIAVQCVTKLDKDNPWERIVSIGGVNQDGRHWKISQERAIDGIESGKWQFYVDRARGDRVNVIVAIGGFNNKYLKTDADADQPRTLLSLPDCK